MANPFDVVRQFENAVAEYTGAPYVVSTTSCTTAILIALAWYKHKLGSVGGPVVLPCRTYVGVGASVKNAGWDVVFEDYEWLGEYRIRPLPVWDSARLFTSGMYRRGQMQCTSHHWTKPLSIRQGGCILHDCEEADQWMRRARFDGRSENVPASEDDVQYPSWHAYMTPEDAAHGLVRLANLPLHNDPLPTDHYPDLSKMRAFK